VRRIRNLQPACTASTKSEVFEIARVIRIEDCEQTLDEIESNREADQSLDCRGSPSSSKDADAFRIRTSPTRTDCDCAPSIRATRLPCGTTTVAIAEALRELVEPFTVTVKLYTDPGSNTFGGTLYIDGSENVNESRGAVTTPS
jgi:hypothetical protein